MAKPNVVKQIPVDELKPHPMNGIIFNNANEQQLALMAEEMNQQGLQHAVEILPDKTIVAGHQRVRAAKQLGWLKIKCRIRHDLAEAGPEAVLRYMLTDNTVRRHCTLMERVRAADELRQQMLDEEPDLKQSELKRRIAAIIQVSPKSIFRYLQLLETPRAVQDAVDGGELSFVLAGRVAGLSDEEKQDISRRIEAGKSAKKVVKEFLASPAPAAEETEDVENQPEHESIDDEYENALQEAAAWLDVVAAPTELPGHLADAVAAVSEKVTVIESRLSPA